MYKRFVKATLWGHRSNKTLVEFCNFQSYQLVDQNTCMVECHWPSERLWIQLSMCCVRIQIILNAQTIQQCEQFVCNLCFLLGAPFQLRLGFTGKSFTRFFTAHALFHVLVVAGTVGGFFFFFISVGFAASRSLLIALSLVCWTRLKSHSLLQQLHLTVHWMHSVLISTKYTNVQQSQFVCVAFVCPFSFFHLTC